MNHFSPPESAIELIEQFFGHFGQAVEAHARKELTEEEKSALTAFARGELDEAARKNLMPLLAHNTTALEYFAVLLGGIDPQAMPSGKSDADTLKTSNPDHKDQ